MSNKLQQKLRIAVGSDIYEVELEEKKRVKLPVPSLSVEIIYEALREMGDESFNVSYAELEQLATGIVERLNGAGLLAAKKRKKK